MSNGASRVRFSLRFGRVGALLLLVILVGCGPAPSPSGTSQGSGNSTSAPEAQARRNLSIVWAGAPGNDAQLTDDDWHAINTGDQVRTDGQGECWLDLKGCMRIYLFQSGKLIKSACPKAEFGSGNVVCAQDGTAAFNNTCGSQVTIQTDTATITPHGTWLTVTYVPQRQLSLVMVFEGSVDAQPVENVDTDSLSEGSSVDAGSFWFTTPGGDPPQVAGLSARTPYPFDRVTPLLNELQLWPWVAKIKERAQQDGIQIPSSGFEPDSNPISTPAPTPRPTAPPTAVKPDFSLSVSPGKASVVQGGSTSLNIGIKRIGGLKDPIRLSTSNLPQNATDTIKVNPADGSSDTITISTSSDIEFGTPAGSYKFTVTGTASGITHSVDATLVVQDFALQVPSTPVTVVQGDEATIPVMINRLQGFSGAVTLSLRLSSFSVRSVGPVVVPLTPTPVKGTAQNLTFSTKNVPPNTYTLQVVGQSGDLTRRSNVGSLVVKAPTGTISGTVRSCFGNTCSPLAGVVVKTDTGQQTETDAKGTYRLTDVPVGNRTVTATSRLGTLTQAVTLSRGETKSGVDLAYISIG